MTDAGEGNGIRLDGPTDVESSRGYQLEMFDLSMKKNVIIAVGLDAENFLEEKLTRE